MIVASVISGIASTVTFVADFFTAILGGVALYAIVKNRSKFGLLFRFLISNVFNERIHRIEATLKLIEGLSFENKRKRPEIRALFGQLAGQLKPFVNGRSDFASVHAEVSKMIDQPELLSEPGKRRIIQETQCCLDSLSLSETQKILE